MTGLGLRVSTSLTHTHTPYYIDNGIDLYFRIPKPVLSPTVVSSVKSNPENQTDENKFKNWWCDGKKY